MKYGRRDILSGATRLGALTMFGSVLHPLAEALAASDDTAITRDLIGTLEGPEVVLDPALWPKQFQEAPMLAARVAAGALPAVKDRVGADPLVIKPLHEIGRYGGTWRQGFTGPGDVWNAWRAATGPDSLLAWDWTGNKAMPNVAKSWSVSDDGHVTTVELRRGMRWSDGHPFTADDFIFWYEDIYNDAQLVAVKSIFFQSNGQQGRVVKVDDYTIQLVFPVPNFILPDLLAGTDELGGHAMQGRFGYGLFAPAHYMKQFHRKYVAEDALNKQAKDAGFPTWTRMFFTRNDWAINPDLPVLTPWVTKSPINRPVFTLERNPYSIWVDTAGNQLPYIDSMKFTLAEDLEVVNLRAIAGQYDWQARHIQLAKLPVLLQNQKANNYKVYLDPGTYGTDMQIAFNHSFYKDPEIAKWIGNVDFRRALSLAIDREELNQIFWLGIGQPRTIVPADDNPYNPGPEYSTLWATHEPDRANAMLDKLGLTKKDSDGYRLRTDGKGRLSFEALVFAASGMPYTQIFELVRTHCQAIGIDLQVNEVERSLGETRIQGNEHQLMAWVGDGIDHLFSFPTTVLPMSAGALSGPQWGLWNSTNGERGMKPDPWMVKVMDNFKRAFGMQMEERVPMVKEIWALLVDNVHAIGTVGLSPAFMGVRVVKNTMGNVPSRQYNSPDVRTPSVSKVMTVYFKT
ncbi:MAG: ABC transporter substrate-binding protein [Acetobacteraceae bacterium]